MKDTTQIKKMLTILIEEKLGKDATMTEIEQASRSLLQELGRQSIEQVIEHKKPQYPAEKVLCQCGRQAKYIRKRSTQLYTMFGKIEVKRAYYLCADCNKGCFPLDDALGLRPNAISAELERLAALTGIQIPFGTGSEFFRELTLVSISDQTMSKATRAIGKKVVQQEALERIQSEDTEEFLRREREEVAPTRLYGAIDATKVHIQDKKAYGWRDLKIGAWFEAQSKPPETPDGRWNIRAENIGYYTDIAEAAEFGKLFWSSGFARCAQRAQELVILGDGAEWIWNLVGLHFPKAVQILDWFHACEHLMPVAQAAFPTLEEQSEWVSDMKQLMWEGEIDILIDCVEQLAAKGHQDIVRTTANYFRNHQKRMDYANFRKRGYLIGSGTIESAAKQIGIMRMKVPGATWNLSGARLVAKARAAYLSDQWHSLPLAA